MRAAAAATAALALLAGAAGCGERERAPAPRPQAGPPLCGELRPRVSGRVATEAASELSGLVASRRRPGVLWAHNDSGDGPRLIALTPRGRSLGVTVVAGARNVDWEDIAAWRETLYVGDTGDNDLGRAEIAVYRLPEPEPGAAVGSQRLALRYPDGPHDAEALLVDPVTGSLVVVTKSFGGEGAVYVAARPRPDRPTTLRRAGRVAVPAGEAVTAADVSGDGGTVALRTYDRALLWRRGPREPLDRTLAREPCVAPAELAAEGQGETLALDGRGRSFFTVPEGRRPALRRYAP